MIKIKIRFIEITRDGKIEYRLERKTFWGRWKPVGKWISGMDCNVFNPYYENTKEELLAKALLEYYKRPRESVMIIEYPMIKIY